MNAKALMVVFLLVSVFLVGCKSSPTSGYTTYNQPQQGQQPNSPYVGGGCGVAPQGAYQEPVEAQTQVSL